ncbi:MAG TPA: glutamine--fructose-6-phosphate transaminase (isomerizing) [Candidatus Limnocylindria bacterium]|nr:glutamine--fructose-6-phosphate transaminase (isomerizing) [Candidatus Limnocylindria bacterium]
MCGIIGYAGPRQAAPILLEGLRKLEYRGYDSAGLALQGEGTIRVAKTRGRLQQLSDMTAGGRDVPGSVGIGHTRWATHGEPSDRNSHPHLSSSGRFAVVHNGIIENYRPLKEMLIQHGYSFRSETDTEVISNLIEFLDRGDLAQTVLEAAHHLEGSYALGVLSVDEPGRIVATRRDSPLIVGKGEGENYIVSDIPAILSLTRDVFLMQDGEVAVISPEGIGFLDSFGTPLDKEPFRVDWDVSAAEKGGYEHFMMKEIMEQPTALRETIRPRVAGGRYSLDGITLDAAWLNSLRMVHVVACGSAYHAGRLGKDLIEGWLGIPVETDIASEFRYRRPILGRDHLVVVVSQSGETADSVAALREAKAQGAKTLAIVNVVGSTIAREADHTLYTWAGPEIAVATTKGYTTQVAAMVLLALYMAQEMGKLPQEELDAAREALLLLPDAAEEALSDHTLVQRIASEYYGQENVYFIGRGVDYSICMEGSLKLKEISYIHSEAQPAGELKHGTISLIQPGTLVIALSTQPRLKEKTQSNIQEVRARGAAVLALCLEGDEDTRRAADHVITVPRVRPELQPILAALPLQLLAYYVAALNGNDVDKPRNLAKSVTVE